MLNGLVSLAEKGISLKRRRFRFESVIITWKLKDEKNSCVQAISYR